MKKLLVATDLSERSDRAIRRALLLAKKFSASLSLIHIVDDDQPNSMIKAGQAAASALLQQQARSLREIDGVACDHRVELGDPFEGITRAVREADPDLVVMGPHRQQQFKDVFVGTTAERTIRASRKPVLMAKGVPAADYRHVLVAADFSDCSRDAMQAVGQLGLDRQITLSVLHVFDTPADGMMLRSSMTGGQIKDYLADEQERAAEELAEFLKEFEYGQVKTLVKYKETSVADIIDTTAREVSADLVVVGTRGRSGIKKLLLGSVTEAILLTTDRDVLAVPPQGARR